MTPRARGSEIVTIQRLQGEHETTRAALARPERLRDQTKSRKLAAVVIVFLAVTPIVLYLSGKSWNRPASSLEIHRDLLLRDALMSESPALDKCWTGTTPERLTLHVGVDTRGAVTHVSAVGAPLFDGGCAANTFAKIRVPASGRTSVTTLDVSVFPRS